jgi:hypothetical protein
MMMMSKMLDNYECLRCSDGCLGTNGHRSYIDVSSVPDWTRRGDSVSSKLSSSLFVVCIGCKRYS